MQATQVQSLGREDLLEKEMATHFSILSWKIPWMEEPGGLPSMGLQRVRHNWTTSLWAEYGLPVSHVWTSGLTSCNYMWKSGIACSWYCSSPPNLRTGGNCDCRKGINKGTISRWALVVHWLLRLIAYFLSEEKKKKTLKTGVKFQWQNLSFPTLRWFPLAFSHVSLHLVRVAQCSTEPLWSLDVMNR